MPQLKQSLALLPAIGSWKVEEVMQDNATIEGLELSFCGIQATHPQFGPVVGGATDIAGTDPSDRAWYELLERISIVEAIKAAPPQFIIRDERGKSVGLMPYNEVFPSPPKGQETTWQPAKSNGVAIEQTWENAAAKAIYELAERHLILETWLGIRKPQNLPKTSLAHVHSLDKSYEAQCVSFGSIKVGTSTIHSCGTFLLPKNESVPLIFGFGAAVDRKFALAKSEGEALQRLSFLWGEPIPADTPKLTPNAMYHQEYFLVPSILPLVKKWLNGEFLNHNKKNPEQTLSVQLVDLSKYAPNGLCVARALSKNAIPLIFGQYRENAFSNLEQERLVHPIA